MSKKQVGNLIAKMHVKLNVLLEESDYNFMDERVQEYSRKLDRAIVQYLKPINQTPSRK
ncbi:hypothetical protein CDQ84_15650 [Clostridium thermosuccinogenes]|jgi:hypothetical protein|uniref:Spo0E family sporulation regulatory protein-aspartic acid phosphatase n=1 Tax=Clostridium thermosuccinogenes TaxID=84032 RepID=A0A2K2F942_9CLOT|nr:Spo0E family sporulation regulatory protein-aspartic acid phosphatase [Pseudoclostridium thermosuccinogenes]AUS98521.1 hypothetical protein CDO33_19930 [Pseudoclostridium thermosuccinogenes]PNT90814.1 hypothetical protein CDQ83_13265 [Pseudoclostridium thermosuccinogenes]PNT95312.1 hypothetical protein CDQ85_15365 [Pseudoclostridium thermosuccinogenes]PNT96224.1 hypothetical protein CDQ84_15650 [Pseudoclostridium thermosuccinogenes]